MDFVGQVFMLYLQFQLAETLGKEFVMTLDEASSIYEELYVT